MPKWVALCAACRPNSWKLPADDQFADALARRKLSLGVQGVQLFPADVFAQLRALVAQSLDQFRSNRHRGSSLTARANRLFLMLPIVIADPAAA
jgi:hypothetical protein